MNQPVAAIAGLTGAVVKVSCCMQEWEAHIERGTLSQLKPLSGRPGANKAKKTLEQLAAADDMVDL